MAKFLCSGYSQKSVIGVSSLWLEDLFLRLVVRPTLIQLATLQPKRLLCETSQ